MTLDAWIELGNNPIGVVVRRVEEEDTYVVLGQGEATSSWYLYPPTHPDWLYHRAASLVVMTKPEEVSENTEDH